MGRINHVCANRHASACTYVHTHARFSGCVDWGPLGGLGRFASDCRGPQICKLLTDVLMVRETRGSAFFMYVNENVLHPTRVMTLEASLIHCMHEGQRMI